MANSSVASSSNSVNSDTTSIANNVERKKKGRRGKKRKVGLQEQTNEASNSHNTAVVEFRPTFVIAPVKQPKCIIFRQRDRSLGPINLKSLATSVIHKLSKLSINGVRTPKKSTSVKKPANKNPTIREKKPKRKKESEFFADYLPQVDVEIGLECGDLIKGFIRVNNKNPNEAYVGNVDVSKYDYVIGSVLDRNRALDGDLVVLQNKSKDDASKLMQVVSIAQQIHPRSAVGFLSPIPNNNEYALFTPRDKRIPKMRIPKISWPSNFHTNPNLYTDILFAAKITHWVEVNCAVGVIVETVGLSGDLKVEGLAIMKEFCLDPSPFPDDVKEFFPKSAKISDEELNSREDFRKECVFTIDPETARDLDDAMSCKALPNGNYEVGVHISDASYYLKENTRLDDIVKKKATTVYMVDCVYHMLPVELCLHCSLLPGQDKLAFSVIWELTPTGDIVNFRMARTVINSCAQLAYEHAQIMIDDPEKSFTQDELPAIHNGFNSRDLSQSVNDLQRIAVCLREKRRSNGSLKIDQVKIMFSLDPATGEPTQFRVYQNKPAHRLIEEFMLLANMTVAHCIHETHPDLAFLRMHEPPKMTMMVDLQRNLETIGFHIDISSAQSIQASLDKYVGHDFVGKCRMTVLNHLLAKPMKRARYFCSGSVEEDVDFEHFALSIPIYTHFTSPIRRYADIVVHRLLAACLNYTDKPNWDPEDVAMIAETCNRQKYHAKRAGEVSTDLYLAHYVDKHQPYIQDAVVVDVKERCFDALVMNTGSVVRIYVNTLGDGVTCKAEEIAGPRNDSGKKLWKLHVVFPQSDTENASLVLEIFALVRVQLTKKPNSNSLEAKLLGPIPEANLLG